MPETQRKTSVASFVANEGFSASAFFDAAQDLLCIIGFDGCTKFLSPSWCKVLGYPIEELLAKNFLNFIHPEDKEATIKRGEFLREGGEVVCFINRYLCQDGSHRWLFWNVKVIDQHFYCLVHDISEQRLVIERMSSLQSARLVTLGQMSGCIAHEINSPLAALGGLANDLTLAAEKPVLDHTEVLRVAGGISSTVKRIAYITKALRNYSRDGAKDPFVTSCVKELVRSTLTFCSQTLAAHGIELEIDIQDGITVDCQGVRISQIILNLMNNALDAVTGEPDKWIKLVATHVGDLVHIEVSDSGPGVPADIASRIMEPFFTTKLPGKGTGLGLSISKDIAHDHGGTLTFQNDNDASCFRLTLPQKQVC